MKRWRSPWVRALLGAAAGFVVSLVVAVNIAIFGGAERGYETPIDDLIDSRPLLAVVVIAVLVVGPVAGGAIAFRAPRRSSGRARRTQPDRHDALQ